MFIESKICEAAWVALFLSLLQISIAYFLSSIKTYKKQRKMLSTHSQTTKASFISWRSLVRILTGFGGLLMIYQLFPCSFQRRSRARSFQSAGDHTGDL